MARIQLQNKIFHRVLFLAAVFFLCWVSFHLGLDYCSRQLSKLCPAETLFLMGDLPRPNLAQVAQRKLEVELLGGVRNGSWRPSFCEPRESLVFIIPYLGNWDLVLALITVLHPVLQRHQTAYSIYVTVQMNSSGGLNMGKLFNSAFDFAAKENPEVTCFIFHPPDLSPATDLDKFKCYTEGLALLSPTKVAIDLASDCPKSIDLDHLQISKSGLDVLGIQKSILQSINGFSNLNQPDLGEVAQSDILNRAEKKEFGIIEPPEILGRFYQMGNCPKVKDGRYSLKSSSHRLESPENLDTDGLSEIPPSDDQTLRLERHKLFTKLIFDV